MNDVKYRVVEIYPKRFRIEVNKGGTSNWVEISSITYEYLSDAKAAIRTCKDLLDKSNTHQRRVVWEE